MYPPATRPDLRSAKDRYVYDYDRWRRVRTQRQKAAIAAAKLGKRVCMAERRHMRNHVDMLGGTARFEDFRRSSLSRAKPAATTPPSPPRRS